MITDFITWTIQNPFQFFALLFIEYVVLFKLYYRAVGTWAEKPVRMIGLVVFIPQDWWMNIILSVLFWDLPGSKGELVTGRMQRYKKQYSWSLYNDMGYRERFRFRFALVLCEHLNKHDPEHC